MANPCFLPSRRASRYTIVEMLAPKMVTGICRTTQQILLSPGGELDGGEQAEGVCLHGLCSESYGVADPTASYGGPFSYREYLNKLLKREFWGDEIVLWAVLMMWGLKIMVLNSKTLQEYRVQHNCAFKHVDVGLVYNSLFSLLGCRLVDWSLAISLHCRWGGHFVGHNDGCTRSILVACHIL